MADSDRLFLDPGGVSRHLYCSICCDVFTEPMRAPCGHSYCKTCIYSWLKHKKTCPEDRKPIKRVSDLHYDFILASANIIGDQKVACQFRITHGCPFIGELQHLSAHTKSCSYNPSNAPEYMKAPAAGATAFGKENVHHNHAGAGAGAGAGACAGACISDDDEGDGEGIASPPVPSLRMRLFTGGSAKKRLLHSMFVDKQEVRSLTTGSSGGGAAALSGGTVRAGKKRAAAAADLAPRTGEGDDGRVEVSGRGGTRRSRAAAGGSGGTVRDGGGRRSSRATRSSRSSSRRQPAAVADAPPPPPPSRATAAWACGICTLFNEPGAEECDACGSAPPPPSVLHEGADEDYDDDIQVIVVNTRGGGRGGVRA